MSAFRVLQLDHVELFVPERHEAARWYRRVLGLEVLQEYEPWAADPRGPLMISSDNGSTKLALFEGTVDSGPLGPGFRLVAFRVAASGFVEFLKRLSELQLRDHRDSAVTLDSVVDHEKAYSLYFSDPYGHRLELTTYDYEPLRAALMELRGHPARG
jgi:catechol 2,3-dioxygenase-like lactoylglutathione lyase family enzyme